ncbi:hypothetical protein GCU68_14585 [Natronorubrum aibiense]|uniref:Uncharacterized protein n=1 Tax=Natronorubrum aibiense TaxID=348826 RepID=A0A5P9P7X3_9EURY|nr:hypothetical protein GCU68_14585 [Natronorubrum aibiense]
MSATAGLAGCVDGVKEHFGLQGIIPLEIHSEADRTYNLHIEAYERDVDRKSYQQSISVSPGETVGAPNLDKAAQSLRVARIVDDEQSDVEAVSLTENTELVVITLYDEEFEVDVRENESAAGSGNETAANETETDANETTNETDTNETTNETDTNETTNETDTNETTNETDTADE